MEDSQWTSVLRVEIKQKSDGSRVWLDVSEGSNGKPLETSRREAYYDCSLLSQEVCSLIDAMCRSLSIQETVAAVK